MLNQKNVNVLKREWYAIKNVTRRLHVAINIFKYLRIENYNKIIYLVFITNKLGNKNVFI